MNDWVEKWVKKNPWISLSKEILAEKLLLSPPHWMEERIEEVSGALNFGLVEESWRCLQEKVHSAELFRFAIRNGKLDSPPLPSLWRRPRALKTYFFLKKLVSSVPLPDLDFILSTGDGCDDEEVQRLSQVPIFAISRAKRGKIALFPHVEWINYWQLIEKKLVEGLERVPWDAREERLFWRGATSGSNYREGKNTRLQVVELGARFPQEIEAHFTHLVQMKHAPSPLKKAIPPWEQIGFKYLLALDGNCFPGSFQWQLGSGSLTFKHDSPHQEWYYGGVSPYQHYLPFQSDGGDLLEQQRWAKAHDEEALQIARSARLFAERYLTVEGMGDYVVRLLREYSRR